MNRIIVALLGIFAMLSISFPAAADRDRDYRDYRGYRERPYDRGRHYGHYKHRKHKYDYHGHWRSWDEWDRYSRRHPGIRRHGRYYYDGPHLMYRYCAPDAGSCIFFSIGR